jgi:hypothetical protein
MSCVRPTTTALLLALAHLLGLGRACAAMEGGRDAGLDGLEGLGAAVRLEQGLEHARALACGKVHVAPRERGRVTRYADDGLRATALGARGVHKARRERDLPRQRG